MKGISWRVIGTIDTFIVSYFYTNHVESAVKIGMAEVLTKIVLYYFHERVWLYFVKENITKHYISVLKGITWRIIGSIDTTILAWIVTGNSFTGIKIGLTEVITKLILYYIHERLWVLIPRGTIRKYIRFD